MQISYISSIFYAIMYRGKLASVTFLTALMLLQIPTAASAAPFIDVTITEAFYADADSNGVDDVIVNTHFALEGEIINAIQYLITLTLPSGRQFSYVVIILTTSTDFVVENTFWDHALESGWYTVEIYVKLGGFYNIMDSDQVVFDPPGGDNADPGGLGVRVV